MSKIYPTLNYEYEERDYHRHQSKETNCGQIFSKGRDILEKLEETELGPKNTVICGHEFKTRQLWVLAGLFLLFLSSCMGIVLMFGTGMFDSFILSKLVLRPETKAFDTWKGPYVTTYVKVYIFNYTNVDDFERGKAEKLNVNEVGPFVYEELLEKVNVKFNSDSTISYQESRTHKFRPDLSKGRRQSDRIIVPNMPMLGAAAASRHSYYFSRVAMSTLLSGMNAKPFLNLPAHRFIWGYDDNFYALAKGVMSIQKKMPYEKVGILTSRNGTSEDVITINSGAVDINKMGQIDNYNGDRTIDHWSTDECNRIEGSDGFIFPPFTIRQKAPVYIYFKELCRRFKFVFKEEIKILNGLVPAYKYVLPETIFDSPEYEPENQCYCDLDSGNCSPQGVFNSTPCTFGVPAFISFPHFYKADPALQNAITGLKPKPEDHESYINIHPKLGFALSGINRLQMNIQVKKSFGMSQLNMFEDDMILPISWMEVGIEDKDLPEPIKDEIYTSSLTLPNIDLSLKIVCLLTAVVTFVALGIVLVGKWKERASRLRKLKRASSTTSADADFLS